MLIKLLLEGSTADLAILQQKLEDLNEWVQEEQHCNGNSRAWLEGHVYCYEGERHPFWQDGYADVLGKFVTRYDDLALEYRMALERAKDKARDTVCGTLRSAERKLRVYEDKVMKMLPIVAYETSVKEMHWYEVMEGTIIRLWQEGDLNTATILLNKAANYGNESTCRGIWWEINHHHAVEGKSYRQLSAMFTAGELQFYNAAQRSNNRWAA